MALSSERNTPRRMGVVRAFPVAAATTIYAGGIVVLADGYAEPASEDTDLRAVGVAEATVDNAGGEAGAESVLVRPGTFLFENSADADEIAQANVGGLCFLVDDETVALTDASGTRSTAGVVVGVDAEGVWVQIGGELFASAGADALGSGISDVSDAVGTLQSDVSTLQGSVGDLETAVGDPYVNPSSLDARVTALENV